jgi:Holliday junction resolvasome RuvABC ATP-dependent DNA helicase subunit
LRTCLGIHDTFWLVAQQCIRECGQISYEQAALVACLENLFPQDEPATAESVAAGVALRDHADWSLVQEFACQKPALLGQLQRTDPTLAADFQKLLLEYAGMIGAAASAPSDAAMRYVVKLAELCAAAPNEQKTGKNDSDPLLELEALVGLSNIKSEVRGLMDLAAINLMRRQYQMPELGTSNHLVFYGNPGTGKTTIARLVGKIMQKLGVLESGHVVEVSRAGLVAGYLGQTAIKVEEAVNSALGGVLFIDEAYALKQREDDSYGQEAIDALLKMMEDHRSRLVVIVAGYTDEMKRFLSSNPGMESRFNRYLDFPDYSASELHQIFLNMAGSLGLHVSDGASRRASAMLGAAVAQKSRTFGNARHVRNLFEQCLVNQARRLRAQSKLSRDDLSRIEEVDLPKPANSGFVDHSPQQESHEHH